MDFYDIQIILHCIGFTIMNNARPIIWLPRQTSNKMHFHPKDILENSISNSDSNNDNDVFDNSNDTNDMLKYKIECEIWN